MLPHAVIVREVDAVVEASELKDDLDYLRLVLTRETVVRLSTEYSFDTLVNHLRTNGILRCVRVTVKVNVLLGQDKDCLVRPDRLLLAVLVRLLNGLLDIAPDVGGVVTVEVDELLLEHWLTVQWVRHILVGLARVAGAGDGVKIVLVSLVSDDVDSLMHANLRVLSAVLFLVAGKNAVIRDLIEVDLH